MTSASPLHSTRHMERSAAGECATPVRPAAAGRHTRRRSSATLRMLLVFLLLLLLGVARGDDGDEEEEEFERYWLAPPWLWGHQFRLLSPESAAGRMAYVPALFSPPIDIDPNVRLQVHGGVDEWLGCKPLPPTAKDGTGWYGKALLMPYDSRCSIATLVYHASLVGARALLLYDSRNVVLPNVPIERLASGRPWPRYQYGNSTDPSLDVDAWLAAQPEGRAYGYASPYPAPAVLQISDTSGAVLLAMGQFNPWPWGPPYRPINVSIPTAGLQLPQAERGALRDLATAITIGSTDLLQSGYGELLPLTALLDPANADANPCTLGIAGLWCENGHVTGLWLNDMQISGQLPDSIAQLSHLRVLSLQNNRFGGPLTDAVCALHQLTQFDISYNAFTSLPDCFCGNLTWDRIEAGDLVLNATSGAKAPLALFNVANNRIGNLPRSIFGCPKLNVLHLDFNSMHSPPVPDLFHNFPELITLKARQAGLSGTLPQLRDLYSLETVDLRHNSKLSGVLTSGSLSGLIMIRSLRIAGLNLTGSFPSLVDSNMLSELDFSDCGLESAIPASWGLLSFLESFSVGGNRIPPPYLLPLDISLLTFVNMSSAGLSCDGFADFASFVVSMVGDQIVELHLANNPGLNCTWGDTWDTPSAPDAPHLTHLKKLDVSGCRLVGLPDTLLRFNAPQQWEYLDLSFNDFEGSLPPAPSPPSSLLYFNARGNPRLRRPADRSSEAFRLKGSAERVSADGLLCPPTEYLGNPIAGAYVDPSYWEYEGCTCDRGSFGVPPDCTTIPTEARAMYRVGAEGDSSQVGSGNSSDGGVFPSSSLLPSFVASQSFSDAFLGSERYTAGVLTNFVLMAQDQTETDPNTGAGTGSSSQAAKLLTLTLYLNPRHFNDYTDILSVYEDGGDLKGRRVFSVHGSDEMLLAAEAGFRAAAAEARLQAKPLPHSLISAHSLAYVEGYSGMPIELMTVNASSAEFASAHAALRSAAISNSPASGQPYLSSALEQVELLHVVTVRVFSRVITLQFQSFDAEGVHFLATYTSSADCPEGTYPTPLSNHCLPLRSASSAARRAVFGVAGAALGVTLLSMGGLTYCRNNNVIRAGSTRFLWLTSFFLVALSLGGLSFAVLPQLPATGASFLPDGADSSSTWSSWSDWSDSAVCNARIWLTTLPLAGVLGVLLAKANRVVTIFTSRTLRSKKVTEADIAMHVAAVLLAQLVLCLVFTLLRLSRASLSLDSSSGGPGWLIQQCSRESGFYSWLGAQIALIGVLTLYAAVLAFQSRDVQMAFNESTQVANGIFALLFLAAVAIPVSILVADESDATTLLQGLSIALMVLVWNVVLFAPKFHYILTGRVFQPAAAIRADVLGPKGTWEGTSPRPGTGGRPTPPRLTPAAAGAKDTQPNVRHVAVAADAVNPSPVESFRQTESQAPSMIPTQSASMGPPYDAALGRGSSAALDSLSLPGNPLTIGYRRDLVPGALTSQLSVADGQQQAQAQVLPLPAHDEPDHSFHIEPDEDARPMATVMPDDTAFAGAARNRAARLAPLRIPVLEPTPAPNSRASSASASSSASSHTQTTGRLGGPSASPREIDLSIRRSVSGLASNARSRRPAPLPSSPSPLALSPTTHLAHDTTNSLPTTSELDLEYSSPQLMPQHDEPNVTFHAEE